MLKYLSKTLNLRARVNADILTIGGNPIRLIGHIKNWCDFAVLGAFDRGNSSYSECFCMAAGDRTTTSFRPVGRC